MFQCLAFHDAGLGLSPGEVQGSPGSIRGFFFGPRQWGAPCPDYVAREHRAKIEATERRCH